MNEFIQLMKFELMITIILFILLFIKIFKSDLTNHFAINLVNGLLLIHLISGFFGNSSGTLFADMFRTNELITLQKNLLSLGTLIISIQSVYWLRNHKHVLEFYMLLLSTLLGMYFMLSSQNLLMFYLSLELSTIPLAALSNFDLDKRRSSEAAMKMIISSAFSSGLLLFGISLLYGTTGTFNFEMLSGSISGKPIELFAFVLLIAGFAFKISAVPFHLWTADVYEGSPVAVTSYLSVISKGAVLFVFVSVLYQVFQPMATTWYQIIFIISIATMVIGNLFAIRQKNIKRFLAFSSIAQVGFILIGLSGNSAEGAASVTYFILIYIFSNLGAFGVISIVSAMTDKEEISDYRGFRQTNPVLAWLLTLSLFSLAGIPPTAGFFGKFFLLMAGAGQGNYILITIAALNMMVSLYYYLIIVKVMFMDKNENPIAKINAGVLPMIAILVCAGGVLVTGFVGGCYEYIYSLVR
jgi:NADH-quinone oxidoreductase subunit N